MERGKGHGSRGSDQLFKRGLLHDRGDVGVERGEGDVSDFSSKNGSEGDTRDAHDETDHDGLDEVRGGDGFLLGRVVPSSCAAIGGSYFDILSAGGAGDEGDVGGGEERVLKVGEEAWWEVGHRIGMGGPSTDGF